MAYRARRGEAQAFFDTALEQDTDECVVWPFSSHKGYGYINKHDQVHVLACERAYGPRPEGLWAIHGPCHNALCFNPRHLSWGTPAQNHTDRLRDGTSNRGERHGLARLTEQSVREIRQRYGTETQRALAREFGVSRKQIQRVLRGECWSWL